MDVKNVVSQMTLEEKASLLSGADMWHLKSMPRFGFPSLMVTDGPHGLRKQEGNTDHLGLNASVPAICFPTAASLASSFDTDLVREVGEALGDECQAEDVAVILGPGVNIKRSPLCGRNFEYFSEDPYAAGEMAAAHISGVQSRNVGTSLKHFAANNQETNRMSVDTIVDERTLREIYLTGFEKAVKQAMPWTVMCCYNRVNGVFGSDNEKLLTKILRDEWGFDGFTVTDWGAMNDKVRSAKAGLDLQMPGGTPSFDQTLVDAVRNGALDESVLDLACTRILTVMDRYLRSRKKDPVFEYEKHHELARRVEAESAILLKNEGLLPIGKGKKIALIGKFAAEPNFQGGGSSHINCWKTTSATEAFASYEGSVVYAQGYRTDRDEIDPSLRAEAIAAAGEADIVLLFAGMPAGFESEGFDRKHLSLPDCQNDLIRAVAEANPETAVILHNSSAVDMPWLGGIKALIEAYLGGEACGGAMYDLITGKVNPSGKLSETFPLRLEDTPAFLNFPGDDKVEYREGIYVGYRWYDARKMDVLFPFGYGLSYTSFAYSDLKIDRKAMKDSDRAVVTCRIRNTGNVFGKEIVQLYVTPAKGGPARPVKELKGFVKVALEPGEEKTVSFTLDKRSFAYYEVGMNDWYVPEGDYGILIGASSRDIRLEGSIHAAPETPYRKPVTMLTTLGELLKDPVAAPIVGGLLQGFLSGGAPASEPQDAPADDGFGMGVAMEEMLNGIPLRSMIAFSGGALTEAAAQELISRINAAG